MYPKVELVEEIRGEKIERMIVNNNEKHHICVGRKHTESC
jgi:hypothetical protein